MVSGEPQHEVRGTGFHVSTEPLREPITRAGIGSLSVAHLGRRLPVISLQIAVELRIVARDRVLVESQGQIHGTREGIGIAPRRAGDLLDLLPLLSQVSASGAIGSQPSK